MAAGVYEVPGRFDRVGLEDVAAALEDVDRWQAGEIALDRTRALIARIMAGAAVPPSPS
ncbi:hypothetical protein [Streptomyces sp. NBC_00687]|uniref:hypothetical protein n=1 Tax=Streptomyces sp. NBC_00687 TaxID=2975807 RepID=UPI00224DA7EF|nr:hypothetical protein [Streptomyces sp. NBC_00687]MCX4919047.1 hypothetical protein [Streptomyces sp. NBC_00687]